MANESKIVNKIYPLPSISIVSDQALWIAGING